MAITAEARPIHTFSPHELQGNGSVGSGALVVGAESLIIQQTVDFPLGDGWSTLKRRVVTLRRGRGDFNGRNGTEAGVGDGRNLLVAGAHIEARRVNEIAITGVDLDPWRAALAQENLLQAGMPQDRLQILVGDAVGHLQSGSESLNGWHLACLPQAPGSETLNHADGIDPSLSTLDATRNLVLGAQSVDAYGLSLNAAYLTALRGRVNDADADVQVTLSGRIPADVRGRLFAETGWSVVEVYGRIVPQDPDTGVHYVNQFADELDSTQGDGFFMLTPEHRGYISIDPVEAEERRRAYTDAETNGQGLNVHHKVFEYIAVPADGKERADVKIYEI